MSGLKGDLRKSDVIIIGVMSLLTFLIVILALLGAGGQLAPSNQAGTGIVQPTPTIDATAVAQDKLKQDDEKARRDNSFPWTILNAVGSSIGTVLIATAALIAAWLGWRQWFTNRKDEQTKRREDQHSEQEKRAEERFQRVVEGLGSERMEASVGAAIMLRTFLQSGYEQFYRQTFDLAVAHLRLRKVDASSPKPLSQLWVFLKGNSATPTLSTSPDSLSQALITVFKEAVPCVRGELEYISEFLDASRVHLDGASLDGAYLSHIYMRGATLTYAHLDGAYLADALLMKANFTGADLWGVNLEGASLHDAIFTNATLIKAKLMNANLTDADLTDADLCGADLSNANLTGTILRGAKYNTRKIRMKVENGCPVIDPQGTILVEKSTKWPQGFKPNGAVDVASSAARPSASSLLPTQSNNTKTPSSTSAQGSTPPPSTDGSGATASQPSAEP